MWSVLQTYEYTVLFSYASFVVEVRSNRLFVSFPCRGHVGRASCAHTDRHRCCARACGSLGSCSSSRVGRIGFEHLRPPLPRMLKCLSSPSAGGCREAGFPRPPSGSAARMVIVAVDGSLLTDNSASFHLVCHVFPPSLSDLVRMAVWDFAHRRIPLVACTSLWAPRRTSLTCY